MKMSGVIRVYSKFIVNQLFRDYYASKNLDVISPSMMNKREFGFLSFDNVMIRHKSFLNKNELFNFLREFVPADAYYSCAYYENPQANMDAKGWLGADLIFDIDADHIPTPCGKTHDEWTCIGCGFSGKGITPEKCPVCGKAKFETKTWPCEVCLETAKKEATKLLDMLIQDFGLSDKEIQVFFSGHRGYHVHVESQAIRALDSVSRKEIVDYVSGLGFDVAFYGLYKGKSKKHFHSTFLNISGWRKRLVSGLLNFIFNAKAEDFKKLGIKANIGQSIFSNKDLILKTLSEKGELGLIKNVGVKTWKKIVEHIVKVQSAKIDTVVTTDIHRLIRLPGTLNSKTGLKKVGFPLSAMDDFDPFKHGIAFRKGALRVFVFSAPAFRIGSEVFGPYINQRVELPTAAAVFLVCKDRAKVVE